MVKQFWNNGSRRGHGSTGIDERRGRAGPAARAFDKAAGRLSEPTSAIGLLQETDDGGREIVRMLGEHQVLAIPDGQPLDSDGRRDDRLGHRHSLVGLDPRATANPERNDVDGGALQMRPHVVHPPGDDDFGAQAQPATQPGRGSSTDHLERDPRNARGDAREDLLDEEQDRVLVRQPVHRSGEDEPAVHHRTGPGPEVVGVDRGGNGKRARRSVPLGKDEAVGVGYRDNSGEALARRSLEALHLPPL